MTKRQASSFEAVHWLDMGLGASLGKGYLHEKKASLEKCDHCDKLVKNTYYCEFCGKSFCSSCTVQEAHYRNMYNQEEHPKQCTSIHKERTGLVHL